MKIIAIGLYDVTHAPESEAKYKKIQYAPKNNGGFFSSNFNLLQTLEEESLPKEIKDNSYSIYVHQAKCEYHYTQYLPANGFLIAAVSDRKLDEIAARYLFSNIAYLLRYDKSFEEIIRDCLPYITQDLESKKIKEDLNDIKVEMLRIEERLGNNNVQLKDLTIKTQGLVTVTAEFSQQTNNKTCCW